MEYNRKSLLKKAIRKISAVSASFLCIAGSLSVAEANELLATVISDKCQKTMKKSKSTKKKVRKKQKRASKRNAEKDFKEKSKKKQKKVAVKKNSVKEKAEKNKNKKTKISKIDKKKQTKKVCRTKKKKKTSISRKISRSEKPNRKTNDKDVNVVFHDGDTIVNQEAYLKGRKYDKAKSNFIYHELMNYKGTINISALGYHLKNICTEDLDNSELRIAYNFMMLEHPDLIQINEAFSATVNEKSHLITTLTPTYIISQKRYAQAIKRVNSEADKIVTQAKKKKTTEGKVKETDRLIRKRVRYKLYKKGISPYGALVERKAFCMGYARTFAMCMDRLHIPCTFEQTDEHIWNRVKIKGKWLVVDTTYNDYDGMLFNLLSKEHIDPDEQISIG